MATLPVAILLLLFSPATFVVAGRSFSGEKVSNAPKFCWTNITTGCGPQVAAAFLSWDPAYVDVVCCRSQEAQYRLRLCPPRRTNSSNSMFRPLEDRCRRRSVPEDHYHDESPPQSETSSDYDWYSCTGLFPYSDVCISEILSLLQGLRADVDAVCCPDMSSSVAAGHEPCRVLTKTPAGRRLVRACGMYKDLEEERVSPGGN